MRVFLAATSSLPRDKRDEVKKSKYILESFYSLEPWQLPYIKGAQDFLLDSGAFTFMATKKNAKINWGEYIEQYGEFVRKHDIKNFFELDIDPIVGYEKVLEYRAMLERIANRQCIPVWHKSRGLEEYRKMCQEYSYVSIGGIVTRELKKQHFNMFPAMIQYAHENNARIHALGFTQTTLLHKYHFDTVDSSSWTYGQRYTHACIFDGQNIIWKSFIQPGKRCRDLDKFNLFNFNEWLKFQQYADLRL